MSRLTDATKNIREQLLSRNLYTPDNQYVLDDRQIVNTINSIASVISPFKGYDVTNTILGRLVFESANSPLTQIGLVMLGKQLAHTVGATAQRNSLPSINFKNILKGGSIFTKNVDNSITVQAGENSFSELLQTLGTYSTANNDPFLKNSSNKEYIKNTGSGQLQNFYFGIKGKSGINANRYVQSDADFVQITQDKEFSIKAFSSKLVGKNAFNNDRYNNFPNASNANMFLEINLDTFVETKNKQNQEYGTTQEFIFGLGDTDLNGIINSFNVDLFQNNWVNSAGGGFDDNSGMRIVWGRDGVDESANEVLAQLRTEKEIQLNDTETSVEGEISANDNISNYFGGDIGLLNYTANLLNASNGSFVDQTRKLFKKNGKLIGFNGSALFTAPSDSFRELADKQGIRQHTALDQYNRFAKAIRFNGNKVYQGNQNSVINEFVMPRITPTISNNTLNNNNLTFSIENLAVETIADYETGVAYLKDEYATYIPITEVGSHGGRMMWFPPYGIELNETTNANWQSTNFIGRSEPIYTYNGSERSANLNFKLIMDYPPQLIAFRGDKENFHKRAAEFFAFGWNGKQPPIVDTSRDELLLGMLQAKSATLGIEKPALFNYPPPAPPLIVSFPNDKPNGGEVNSIFDSMYNNMNYEIIEGLNGTDGTGFGLNKKIYNIVESQLIDNGEGGYTKSTNTTVNQYTTGNSKLDIYIIQNLNPQMDGIKNTVIVLEGSSSKLYAKPDHVAYNKALSQRRIAAVKKLISDKFFTIFKIKIDQSGIIFKEVALGDTTASEEGAKKENIPIESVKQERSVKITVQKGTKTNKKVDSSVTNTTSTDQKNKESIDANIAALTHRINSNTTKLLQYNGDVFGQMGEKDGPQNGFLSIGNNTFYPAFHSQTPDDFHKRLTFLQQCVRQGPSIKRFVKFDSLSSNNSAFGRPPICILRIGDFFYTKVVIENVIINYQESSWDLNPEGRGMQPMIAEVSLQMKVIGGQSLRGPIDALQNAVSFNMYANSTYSKEGTYSTPALVEALQYADREGIDTLQKEKLVRANDRANIVAHNTNSRINN